MTENVVGLDCQPSWASDAQGLECAAEYGESSRGGLARGLRGKRRAGSGQQHRFWAFIEDCFFF